MYDTKEIIKPFFDHLVNTLQGSMYAYAAVTRNAETTEEKSRAWQQYNNDLRGYVIDEILAMLEKNHVGVAELCHIVIVLMTIASGKIEALDAANEEPQLKDNDEIMFFEVKRPIH